MIEHRIGQPIYGTTTHHLACIVEAAKAGTIAAYTFRFAANLGQGTLSVAVALHAFSTHITKNYDWRDLALIFNRLNFDKETFIGAAWLPPTLQYTSQSASQQGIDGSAGG